jgi:hypothetical protein
MQYRRTQRSCIMSKIGYKHSYAKDNNVNKYNYLLRRLKDKEINYTVGYKPTAIMASCSGRGTCFRGIESTLAFASVTGFSGSRVGVAKLRSRKHAVHIEHTSHAHSPRTRFFS